MDVYPELHIHLAAQAMAAQRGYAGPIQPARPGKCGTLRQMLAAVDVCHAMPNWRKFPDLAFQYAVAMTCHAEPELVEQPQAISIGPMPTQTATRRRVRT